MAFTPNLLQHPREWAPSNHSSGSHFRVETSVAIQTTPSLPQLERLLRFVVNSLLVETSSTQVYTENMPAPATSRGKITITVKERSIHRARELAVELQGWSSSSLREVLLTCGVCRTQDSDNKIRTQITRSAAGAHRQIHAKRETRRYPR